MRQNSIQGPLDEKMRIRIRSAAHKLGIRDEGELYSLEIHPPRGAVRHGTLVLISVAELDVALRERTPGAIVEIPARAIRSEVVA